MLIEPEFNSGRNSTTSAGFGVTPPMASKTLGPITSCARWPGPSPVRSSGTLTSKPSTSSGPSRRRPNRRRRNPPRVIALSNSGRSASRALSSSAQVLKAPGICKRDDGLVNRREADCRDRGAGNLARLDLADHVALGPRGAVPQPLHLDLAVRLVVDCLRPGREYLAPRAVLRRQRRETNRRLGLCSKTHCEQRGGKGGRYHLTHHVWFVLPSGSLVDGRGRSLN